MSPTPTTSRRLTSSPTQSKQGFPDDAEDDDAALEDMLREAHRVHVHHSQREDLSVGLLERERGDLLSKVVRVHKLGFCSTNKKSEFLPSRQKSTRNLRKLGEIVESQREELHCARAEEVQRRDQQLLQGQLLQQNLELREAHQKSLNETEELKKFQSSTFDTMARRRLVKGQDTILELTGRIQVFRNETNCMSDSKVAGCWFNSKWKFPRYLSTSVIPTTSNSWRNAQPFFWSAEPQRRAAKHLGHTWYIGKRFFCKSRCVIISTLSSRLESMEFIDRGAASFIHSGKESKANTRLRAEMQVWTVSQRFSHLQWRRLFKELWGRPTTTADFWSSLWQIPYTSNLRLLEDKVQDRGMYLFTISYGSNAVDQRSGVGWFSGWVEIFVIYSWYFKCRILKYLMRALLQHWTKSSIIPTSKEESGWRNKKAQKQDRFLRGRQIAYLIYAYFRVTGSHDSVENYTDLFTVVLRNDDIQEFDSKLDGILLSMTKIPPDDILEGLYK